MEKIKIYMFWFMITCLQVVQLEWDEIKSFNRTIDDLKGEE